MPTTIIESIGSGVGRDYSTPAAWESATKLNLVSLDQVRIGELYDDSDFQFSAQLSITGATVDATRHRILRAGAGQAYNPVTDTGVLIRDDGASNSGTLVRMNENFLQCSGFKILHSATTKSLSLQSLLITTGNNQIASNIFVQPASDMTGSVSAVKRWNVAGDAQVRNVITKGFASASSGADFGFDIQSGNNGKFHNCIAYKSGINGFLDTAAGVEYKNCAASNSVSADWSVSSTTSSNNASSDSSAPGTSPVTGMVDTAVWTAPASDDFTLKSGGALIDVGADLSGEFTYDFVNITRTAPWDIGAYDKVIIPVDLDTPGLPSTEAFGFGTRLDKGRYAATTGLGPTVPPLPDPFQWKPHFVVPSHPSNIIEDWRDPTDLGKSTFPSGTPGTINVSAISGQNQNEAILAAIRISHRMNLQTGVQQTDPLDPAHGTPVFLGDATWTTPHSVSNPFVVGFAGNHANLTNGGPAGYGADYGAGKLVRSGTNPGFHHVALMGIGDTTNNTPDTFTQGPPYPNTAPRVRHLKFTGSGGSGGTDLYFFNLVVDGKNTLSGGQNACIFTSTQNHDRSGTINGYGLLFFHSVRMWAQGYTVGGGAWPGPNATQKNNRAVWIVRLHGKCAWHFENCEHLDAAAYGDGWGSALEHFLYNSATQGYAAIINCRGRHTARTFCQIVSRHQDDGVNVGMAANGGSGSDYGRSHAYGHGLLIIRDNVTMSNGVRWSPFANGGNGGWGPNAAPFTFDGFLGDVIMENNYCYGGANSDTTWSGGRLGPDGQLLTYENQAKTATNSELFVKPRGPMGSNSQITIPVDPVTGVASAYPIGVDPNLSFPVPITRPIKTHRDSKAHQKDNCHYSTGCAGSNPTLASGYGLNPGTGGANKSPPTYAGEPFCPGPQAPCWVNPNCPPTVPNCLNLPCSNCCCGPDPCTPGPCGSTTKSDEWPGWETTDPLGRPGTVIPNPTPAPGNIDWGDTLDNFAAARFFHLIAGTFEVYDLENDSVINFGNCAHIQIDENLPGKPDLKVITGRDGVHFNWGGGGKPNGLPPGNNTPNQRAWLSSTAPPPNNLPSNWQSLQVGGIKWKDGGTAIPASEINQWLLDPGQTNNALTGIGERDEVLDMGTSEGPFAIPTLITRQLAGLQDRETFSFPTILVVHGDINRDLVEIDDAEEIIDVTNFGVQSVFIGPILEDDRILASNGVQVHIGTDNTLFTIDEAEEDVFDMSVNFPNQPLPTLDDVELVIPMSHTGSGGGEAASSTGELIAGGAVAGQVGS